MSASTWQPNPYSISLVLLGILTIAGASIASQRRSNPSAIWLTWLMVAISVWSLGYALEIAFGDLPLQVLMAKIEYFGIVSVPLFWFFFAMEYTGRGALLRQKRLGWLSLFPVITLAMVWSNEVHHLIWTYTGQIEYNGILFFTVEHGAYYWVHVLYSYALILTGSILFLQQALKRRKTHRTQAAAVLAAVLITWGGNIIYHTPFNPFPYLDLTSFAMSTTGLVLIFSLLRVGPLDLFPVIGESILERMNDGILVVDDQDRILYANTIFRRYANLWPETYAGRLLDDALENWPGFAEAFKEVKNMRAEVRIAPDPVTNLYFDLRISPILNRNRQPVGRVFVLHDISERKHAEMRLTSSEEAADDVLTIRALETSIPFILLIKEEDGRLVEVNRAFVLAIGHGRSSLAGHSLAELGIWSEGEQTDFLNQIHGQGRIENRPIRLHRKSGQPLNLNVTARRLEVGSENFIAWIAWERREK
ncbi:MAG: histidine kinase N-terminal 7TM domain-containing protein [Anaerolineales bacterium]